MQASPRAHTLSMWLPEVIQKAATKAATKPATKATTKSASYLATKYPGKWLSDLNIEQYMDVLRHDPELRAIENWRARNHIGDDFS